MFFIHVKGWQSIWPPVCQSPGCQDWQWFHGLDISFPMILIEIPMSVWWHWLWVASDAPCSLEKVQRNTLGNTLRLSISDPLSLVSCKDSCSAFPLSYMILYQYHYQVFHETNGKLPFWLAPWAFPMSFLIMHLSLLSIRSPRALSRVRVFWNRTGIRVDVIRTFRVTSSIRNTSNKRTYV